MRLRQLARNIVWASGLQGALFRFREWKMAAAAPPPNLSDRKPLPPALLRVRSSGDGDPNQYLTGGRAVAAEAAALFAQAEAPLDRAAAVLDLGCGCGRVLRWLKTPGVVTGMDIDPEAIAWCARNLAGAFVLNRLGAPLPSPDKAFDIVYAGSVLPHLRRDTAQLWLGEIGRVLRPGGAAMISFHDERHPQAAPVLDTLARDGFAVRFDSLEGSNMLSAFITADRLAQMAGPALTLVHSAPSGATICGQAVAVLRKAP